MSKNLVDAEENRSAARPTITGVAVACLPLGEWMVSLKEVPTTQQKHVESYFVGKTDAKLHSDLKYRGHEMTLWRDDYVRKLKSYLFERKINM